MENQHHHTHCPEWGNSDDPALLLIHGLGGNHHFWHPQVETFSREGYRVLAPDMLGHGRSSRVTRLSLNDWTEQLLRLLDQRGIASSRFVGVSMGGVIAQAMAVAHPERVGCLVLADTFGELRTIQERVLGASQILGLRIFQLLGRKVFARAMASAYKPEYTRLAREYITTTSLEADFNQLVLARRAINEINAVGRIDGRRIPTLVLAGSGFGEAFVKVNQKIAHGIQGAEFRILDQAMDPSNLVNPGAFNQAVLDFLAAHQNNHP